MKQIITPELAQQILSINEQLPQDQKIEEITFHILHNYITNPSAMPERVLKEDDYLNDIQRVIGVINTYRTIFGDILTETNTHISKKERDFFDKIHKKIKNSLFQNGLLIKISTELGSVGTCYTQQNPEKFYLYMKERIGIDESTLRRIHENYYNNNTIARCHFFLYDTKTIKITINQAGDSNVITKKFQDESDTIMFIRTIIPPRLGLSNAFLQE